MRCLYSAYTNLVEIDSQTEKAELQRLNAARDKVYSELETYRQRFQTANEDIKRLQYVVQLLESRLGQKDSAESAMMS